MPHSYRFLLFIPFLFAFVVAGCQEPSEEGSGVTTEGRMAEEDMTEAETQGEQEMAMAPDSLERTNLAPLVPACYESKEAFFIHTETSSESVAEMLTEMMGPINTG